MNRRAEIQRITSETDVRLALDLDGRGDGHRITGVGFFDHLLDAFARHGRLDLDVSVEGDLQTGPHHTVEDTGLVLGQAVGEGLGDRSGIRRFGHAVVPMDDARVECAVDVSGRPYATLEGEIPAERVADFDCDLLEEFIRAVANTGRLCIHVTIHRGTNAHHVVEASFKALARALADAVAIDGDVDGVPSTKGSL